MAAIMILAMAAINAPAGYIVGSLAQEHYPDEAGTDLLPILCAVFAPLSAAEK